MHGTADHRGQTFRRKQRCPGISGADVKPLLASKGGMDMASTPANEKPTGKVEQVVGEDGQRFRCWVVLRGDQMQCSRGCVWRRAQCGIFSYRELEGLAAGGALVG